MHLIFHKESIFMKTMTRYMMLLGVLLMIGAGLGWFLQKPDVPNVLYTPMQGGTPITQDALKGQVVLLNFWATDCPGCVEEMAAFKRIQTQLEDEPFQIITVAMDYDKPSYIETFFKDHELSFFLTHDQDGAIAQAFGSIYLLPTTVLIDANGKEVQRYTGSPVETAESEAQFVTLLQALIEEAKQP
jgi:peroxiredoxin